MIINVDERTRIAPVGARDNKPWVVQRLEKSLFVLDEDEDAPEPEWRSACPAFETLLGAVEYVSGDIASGRCGAGDAGAGETMRALRETALHVDEERQNIACAAVSMGVGDAAREACRMYDTLIESSAYEFSADGEPVAGVFNVCDAAFACRDAAEKLVLRPLFNAKGAKGGGA